VSSDIPVNHPITGNEAVRDNLHRLGYDTVSFTGDRFATCASYVAPGAI